MTIYYSATTNAFYDSQVYNVNNIPEDKVAVAESTYKNLMAQQCAGRVIVAAADGTPTTIAQTCGPCTSTKYATKTELTNGLAAKANDSNVVHKTGDETINGVKSFGSVIKATNGTVQVGADTGYSVTFNYNGNITSKQARGTYNIFFPEGSGTLALTSDINGKANDSDVVHKTGDETIAGTKTFSNRIISNKDLHYKDTTYNWADTSLNVWCDAGHVAWFDKTGNRRMHELVGTQSGVWRKVCYINGNQYFSVDSNRNVSFNATVSLNGAVSLNGNVFACNNFFHKNSNMDITTNPSKTLYTDYTFKDKNNETLSYIQYAHNPNGIHNLGLFIRDSEDKLYGVVVNSAKEFYPFGHNAYSLGTSDRKWANVYATTFNGNLKGNADTATSATKASYLDNYSLPGGNKIYLDWSQQVKGYVGLKVDNAVMGGLITTNNIGSYIPTTPNAYVTATWRSGSNWYRKWSDGFIEQGGRISGLSLKQQTITVTFPIAFSDNQYTVNVTSIAGDDENTLNRIATVSKTLRTTSMTIVNNGWDNTYVGITVSWYACGY